jgi:hypothetical protein
MAGSGHLPLSTLATATYLFDLLLGHPGLTLGLQPLLLLRSRRAFLLPPQGRWVQNRRLLCHVYRVSHAVKATPFDRFRD